ncbi:MAG: alpha/beta hydrolase fold domain-containing protein, partial [Planctomycetes bacterium]|nr:alpha/beta hydrolase fold domain-containing protein [Planctomycetota bacterium]
MRTIAALLELSAVWAILAAASPFGVEAAETAPRPDREIAYKRVGDVELRLHAFEPEGHRASDRRPAIVFFFGGGWVGGSPSQFYPQAAHLASRGMLAFCAEYRVASRHETTPFDCVRDGKSAIRWVRAHAAELGADPARIAAGGGSAGGHVAAAAAAVPGLEEEGEDRGVSPRPDALVLFNPVYDNGPDGWGHAKVKDRWREISPLHNIREGMPPAIVFLGTQDRLIPVETARRFQARMREVGSRSELVLFEGAGHGFFNHGRGDGSAYRDTVRAMDRFLESLGYLASDAAAEAQDDTGDAILWDPSAPVPTAAETPLLRGVRFSTIQKREP